MSNKGDESIADWKENKSNSGESFSTCHKASRRCLAKQFSAPISASVRSSDLLRPVRHLKSSIEMKGFVARWSAMRWPCSWRRPSTTQKPNRIADCPAVAGRIADGASSLHSQSDLVAQKER